MKFIKLEDLDLKSKTVLIRADMNVPLKDGKVAEDTRIKASISSINTCFEKGAKAVIVMSHLGRPKEGELTDQDSLAPVASRLSELISKKVRLEKDLDSLSVNEGDLILLENVRCNIGEKKNSDELGKKYASLCDVFVHDAFATSHRAEASTYAVAKFAKVACAGLLLSAELEALGRCLQNPARPLLAIVGGAKVSTKLSILNSLADKVDKLIVGGGIANTFLMAEGVNIGASLCEPDLVNEAKSIIEKIKSRGGNVPLPVDVVVSTHLAADAPSTLKPISEIKEDEMILDFGPKSMQSICSEVKDSASVVFNGPIGVFEFDAFAKGTKDLVDSIVSSNAFSLAGGGDTIAALEKFGVRSKISYVSTGGGAFLEFLEGKTLPAVEVLSSRV